MLLKSYFCHVSEIFRFITFIGSVMGKGWELKQVSKLSNPPESYASEHINVFIDAGIFRQLCIAKRIGLI